MQQTISQAAKLYGKARSTIHRAIDAGRLSCTVRGDGVRVVDLSELIRLWGEPDRMPPEAQQDATAEGLEVQRAMLRELEAMRTEITALRQEVAELRALPAPSNYQGGSSDLAAVELPATDDPHGFRAMVQAMRGPE